jgi:hypothetical protein
MRLLRGVAGLLLWIVAALLGLVGVVLCVTVILLPLGIPLLGYARRLLALSMKLMLPRAVSHPVETAGKSMHKQGGKAKTDVKHVRKRGRKTARQTRKKLRLG